MGSLTYLCAISDFLLPHSEKTVKTFYRENYPHRAELEPFKDQSRKLPTGLRYRGASQVQCGEKTDRLINWTLLKRTLYLIAVVLLPLSLLSDVVCFY